MNTGIDGHEHTLILHKHVNKKIPNFENLLKPYNTFISEYNMKSLYFLGLTSLTVLPQLHHPCASAPKCKKLFFG